MLQQKNRKIVDLEKQHRAHKIQHRAHQKDLMSTKKQRQQQHHKDELFDMKKTPFRARRTKLRGSSFNKAFKSNQLRVTPSASILKQDSVVSI